jgi:reverse transcriptase-like protein
LPVARLSSFRLILAIAAHYNWDIESFNFIGAYLNGKLDDNEEIYMQSPPGYSSDANTMKQLQKSLYRLK